MKLFIILALITLLLAGSIIAVTREEETNSTRERYNTSEWNDITIEEINSGNMLEIYQRLNTSNNFKREVYGEEYIIEGIVYQDQITCYKSTNIIRRHQTR